MYSKFRVSANQNVNAYGEAFRLYFGNFPLFLSVLLPPTVFISLVILVNKLVNGGANESAGDIRFMFIGILYLFSIIYTYIAVAYASVFVITEERTTVSEIYNLIPFRKINRLVLAIFLKSLIIGVGFLFFIIPGLYFMISFLFVELVIIFEGKGIKEALGRSREIISSDFWGFVLVIIPFLIGFLAFGVFYKWGFTTLVTGILGGAKLSESVNMITDIILGNVLLPLNLTFMSMLYLVYRINEEGLTKDEFLTDLKS
ncbi:MAG: hypothetical protein ACE5GM_09635 [bacterium]